MSDSGQDVLGEVNELIRQLESKRSGLVEKRDDLETRIAALELKLEECNVAIEQVEKIMGPLKQVPQPRVRGAKKNTEAVLRELVEARVKVGEDGWVSQDVVVARTVELHPDMKPHSVVSALGRLYDGGVAVRRGKRGSRDYMLKEGQGQSTASSGDGDGADPTEAILAKLREAGDLGCSKQDLVWAVGDGVEVDGVLHKLIEDGEVVGRLLGLGGAEHRFFAALRASKERTLFGTVGEGQPPATPSPSDV